MRLIICADDRLGLMFNHRRLSKDRAVAEHILKMIAGRPLYLSPYSLGFFSDVENDEDFVITSDCLTEAGPDDYCFAEDGDFSAVEDNIQSLILFRWNRHYPSNRKLSLDWGKFELQSIEEFSGFSHEKISKEVYQKL